MLIMDNVQEISLNILTLTRLGQPAIAIALEDLADTICVSQEISFSQQAKFLDQLEKLSKQATLVREKRAETQIIKSILMNLATDLDASDRLSTVWSAWIHVIRGFFGCQEIVVEMRVKERKILIMDNVQAIQLSEQAIPVLEDRPQNIQRRNL